jgi:hypothetical protein
MGELIAFLRRELEKSGVSVEVADRIKSSVEQQFAGERLYIGRPSGEAKRAILGYGSSVPATYIARQLGVTVRHVRKVRQMLK